MITTMDIARALMEALPTIFIFVWAYFYIARLKQRIEDIAQCNERQITHLQSALQEVVKALSLLAGERWKDDATEDDDPTKNG